MSRILIRTGINEIMVEPLTRFMRTPALAFLGHRPDHDGNVLRFSGRTPGVASIGAVLLPVAVRVRLPRAGAAMAMNLFGHGIAPLRRLFVQGAPKLTRRCRRTAGDQRHAKRHPARDRHGRRNDRRRLLDDGRDIAKTENGATDPSRARRAASADEEKFRCRRGWKHTLAGD